MNIHFIAIGGSAMHNLAIALHLKGFRISGSDDEIFNPARAALLAYGLLPPSEGWFPEKINPELDAVILGMHARADNPELIRAQELGLKIYSYPEFLYEQSKEKTRVVIGGSHGKTTITAMILHVLHHYNKDVDYMIGARIEGFDVMVRLTKEAPIMVIEGDEYLTSPIDLRPKFHVYRPNIALISGIAWDHMNVFPTFEIYCQQFATFADLICPNGSLIYYAEDKEVKKIGEHLRSDIQAIPYAVPSHKIENGKTFLLHHDRSYPLAVFGQHNLLNMEGARYICALLGISSEDFYTAIQSFKGASRRLELVSQNACTAIYQDFAHSPSKLKATVEAMKTQFPERELFACMELHTFSSLKSEFLKEYKGCMDHADNAIVYFNPETIRHKKLSPLTVNQVKEAFAREDLMVYTSSEKLQQDLLQKSWQNRNLLLMSSGNFDGMNIPALADSILKMD